ncbi:MAG: putative sulfate exporter family transporter [Candidatus Omnitrophica bacterium]|nr:putative sulfate exporter family transporter [Candidatus Omnitrophota bacterium]
MEEPRGISMLWKLEDYWAIWLGFLLIAIGLMIFLPRPPDGMRENINAANAIMQQEANAAPIKTIAWHKANDSKMKIKASGEGYAKQLANWIAHPQGWKTNPIESLALSQEKAEAKNSSAAPKYEAAQAYTAEVLTEAQEAENAARAAGFKDASLNEKAKSAIAEWRKAVNEESAAKKKASVSSYNHILHLIVLCIFLAVFFGVGMAVMGKSFSQFCAAFPVVFLIAVLAYMLDAQSTMKEYGIGYAAWAIIFGLLISNTIGTPKWLMPAVQTEYYIKTGLVLLGAEILFGKILAIGTPGIFVAWVVTPIVLIATYLFGQKILKISSRTLNITISADMSVCGVSAAIATAAACRAKKEELTLAVGMSLIFTSIMMIIMPNFILAVGMDPVLGGAWMGGTIDATGAVAAAGAFLGDKALYVAATIKMIQNVLIGVIAFFVAVYWCWKVERDESGSRISIMEIWHRFPKFVLGFITASILFSILYQAMGGDVGYAMVDNGVLRGFTRIFRGWFFCMAFVSIGLATDFRELKKYFVGGKPLILYVCGQSLNLILTLTMAYIMFYLVFPDITAKI